MNYLLKVCCKMSLYTVYCSSLSTCFPFLFSSHMLQCIALLIIIKTKKNEVTHRYTKKIIKYIF